MREEQPTASAELAELTPEEKRQQAMSDVEKHYENMAKLKAVEEMKKAIEGKKSEATLVTSAGVERAKPAVDYTGTPPAPDVEIPPDWPHFFDTDEFILKGYVFRPIGFREEDQVLELKAVRASMALQQEVDRKREQKRKMKKARTKRKRRRR